MIPSFHDFDILVKVDGCPEQVLLDLITRE